MEEIPPPPGYDPAAVAAIRAAREDLYVSQAARRRRYLLTGHWTPQLQEPPAVPRGDPNYPPDAVLVDIRRGNLDEARAAAKASLLNANL